MSSSFEVLQEACLPSPLPPDLLGPIEGAGNVDPQIFLERDPLRKGVAQRERVRCLRVMDIM